MFAKFLIIEILRLNNFVALVAGTFDVHLFGTVENPHVLAGPRAVALHAIKNTHEPTIFH